MECPACRYLNLPGDDECEECCCSLTHEAAPRAITPIEVSLIEETVERLHPAPAVSISFDTTLSVAIERMREKEIGCLLVTKENGGLCGILTERDLLYKVTEVDLDLDKSLVGDYMTSGPETIQREEPLARALHLMMVGGYRHLPLVDENGRPDGIVSSRDIINFIEFHTHDCADPDANVGSL